MTAARRVLVLSSCIAVLLPVVQILDAHPSQSADGGIAWGISVERCHRETQGPCVFFAQQREVEIRFGLSNLDHETLDIPSLASGASVRLRDSAGRDRAIEVVWSDMGDRSSAGAEFTNVDVTTNALRLAGGDSVRVQASVRLVGRPLTAGIYTLVFDLQPVIQGIRNQADQPWMGRAVSTEQLSIAVRQPQSATDLAVFHRLESSYFISKRQPRAALPHLEQLVSMESSVNNLTNLGRVYLQVGQGDAAATTLNRAVETMPREMPQSRQRLLGLLAAQANLAVRDEVGARRALQLTGHTATEIETSMRRMRTPK